MNLRGTKLGVWRVLVGAAAVGVLLNLLLYCWSPEPVAALVPPPALASKLEVNATAENRTAEVARQQSLRAVPFVAGVIVDKLSGGPVPAARVLVGNAECQSNASGAFHVAHASDIESGELIEIRIEADGYATCLVQQPASSDLRIELQRNRGLSIHVFEESTGLSITKYKVALLRHDADDMSAARRSGRKLREHADNEHSLGWAWFCDVTPQQYFVLVQLEGDSHIAPVPKLVNWLTGHGELRLAVGLAGRLTVQLLEADGSPVLAPHQVRLALPLRQVQPERNYGERRDMPALRYAWEYPWADGSIRHAVATSDGEGRVSLPCPRSEAVELAVMLEDLLLRTVPHVARDADADEVSITLPPSVALSGTVGPPALLHAIHPEWLGWGQGSGEAGVAAWASDESVMPKLIAYANDRESVGGDAWQAVIAANGEFRLDHLPLGRWQLYLTYYSMDAKQKPSLMTGEFGDYEWWVARSERLDLDGSELVPLVVRVACRTEQGLLSGANILVSDSETSRSLGGFAADKFGVVSLRLGSGRYVVSYFDKALGKRRRGLLVTSGNVTDYDLDFGFSNLEVRVRRQDGSAVSVGTRMRVRAPGIAWSSRVASSGEHGVLAVASVPNHPGDLLLEVETAGRWVSYPLAEVREGAARTTRVVSVVLH